MNIQKLLRAVAIGASLSAVPATFAWAAPVQGERQELGTLKCRVGGGVGFIITSRKALSCVFDRSGGVRSERYAGTVSKYGLDLGVTQKGEMVWVVYRVGDVPKRGSLAGNFVGIGTEATLGIGLGAGALVGGSGRSISLQPFSGQAQTGLDIALGVQELRLDLIR